MPVTIAKALACSIKGSPPVISLILLRSNLFMLESFVGAVVVAVAEVAEVDNDDDDDDDDVEAIAGSWSSGWSCAPFAWAAKFLSA